MSRQLAQCRMVTCELMLQSALASEPTPFWMPSKLESPAQAALGGTTRRRRADDVGLSDHIRENFGISPLPDDAMAEIRNGIAAGIRFNAAVETLDFQGFPSGAFARSDMEAAHCFLVCSKTPPG